MLGGKSTGHRCTSIIDGAICCLVPSRLVQVTSRTCRTTRFLPTVVKFSNEIFFTLSRTLTPGVSNWISERPENVFFRPPGTNSCNRGLNSTNE